MKITEHCIPLVSIDSLNGFFLVFPIFAIFLQKGMCSPGNNYRNFHEQHQATLKALLLLQ